MLKYLHIGDGQVESRGVIYGLFFVLFLNDIGHHFQSPKELNIIPQNNVLNMLTDTSVMLSTIL